MEKYKKIFVIIIFVLLVAVFGYLLYIMFFKPSPTPTPAGPEATTTGPGGLPISQPGGGIIVIDNQGKNFLVTDTGEKIEISKTAQGGLTQTTELNQIPSLGATLSAEGSDLIYYNKLDGKFYRIDKTGKSTQLSDAIFHEVQKITWSPDKNKAILEYPDEAKIIYNFQTNQQISLPKHWQDFDFSPDGSKIVLKSMADSEDNRWLAVINDSGTEAIRIASLGDKDETVYPSWSPNNQTVAMYTEGVSFDQQRVFFVGLNQENFKALTIEGRGFQPKWSPAGDRLLYSVYSSDNGLRPELWLANAQGDNIGSGRAKLDIQTWADKCTFASKTEVYCAVPEQLEEGAGLFPELAENTRDNLYKINIQTGIKRLIAVPTGQYTMSNLIVTENADYLYFTDASTGLLNQIKLK